MSTFPFPSNPSNGDTYTLGTNTYTYSSATDQWTGVAATGGALQLASVITTSTTFTIPSGVTSIKATVVGGGGGGSEYASGGAGGGAAIKWLNGLTPGNTIIVTIGAGGVGGSGGTSQIVSGTQTISTVLATGGGTFRIPGEGSYGDINIKGGVGISSTNVGGSANGGSSLLGSGGAGATSQPGFYFGYPGGLYGGGGGGGYYDAGGSQGPGGAGAPGVVIFEYTVASTSGNSSGGFSGATTNAVGSSAITLTASSTQYQVCQINSYTNSYVTLPNATTLTAGSNPFVIENRSPVGANLEIRDSAGTTVGYVPIGQIGLVQLKDISTSAGSWAVEVTNPQSFFKYDSNSITAVTSTPAPTYDTYGVVGLTATTFVRWWAYGSFIEGPTTQYCYIYTQVGTISGSTITFGSIQNTYTTLSSNVAVPGGSMNTRATRLSNTAFIILTGQEVMSLDYLGYAYYGASSAVNVNTVSGTVVTFGSFTSAGMPSFSASASSQNQIYNNGNNGVKYNGLVCRISDTAFALFYNDGVTTSYTYPYNYSGSLACQIITVSGTTLTVGTKVNLGTSTYTQPTSAVAVSSTSVFLSYAQATATGGSAGRTKLVMVSVSGTVPTFNTPVTCESIDVLCFGTSRTATVDGAVAPSATQVIFNAGYAVGEATVSGTVPTFDAFPYSISQLYPMFLCTSSKAWVGGSGAGGYGSTAYLSITTGGFVASTNVVNVLQTNLTVSSAFPAAALGTQPTTSFVAYKANTYPSVSSAATLLLGTTT